MSGFPLRFAVLFAAFTASSVRAADLPPQQPADLVRGLREAGLSDLALEYLDQVGRGASPDDQLVFVLERARLRVDLADQETDDVKQDELLVAAKKGFNEFLSKAENHPRAPQAAVSVARIDSLQGAARYAQALAHFRTAAAREGEEKTKATAEAAAEAAKARALYLQASSRFATASRQLEAQASAATGERQKELTREVLQAQLDAAINQYRLGLAYLDDTRPRGAAIQAAYRGQAADKKGGPALVGLGKLSSGDRDQPVTWIAGAWLGECYLKVDEKKKAEDTFKALQLDHRRTNTVASRAGYRMARFFELRVQFDVARTPAENRAVATDAARWLAEFRSARPTPETFSVRYFRARAEFDLARGAEVIAREAAEKSKRKLTVLPAEVVQLYRSAEAELRTLVTTDNEYTERATGFRNAALRSIIGDVIKPPAEYVKFEECHMAGMVQYMKMTEAKPEDRAPLIPPTLAILERARQLPVPPESAREGQTAILLLVSAYRIAGRPSEAAVLSEYAMRAARAPAGIAKFGTQALASYLQSAARVPADDPNGRRVDTDHALEIARFLDTAIPADPVAEEARIIIGDHLNRDGRPLEAFETFARVSPNATRFAVARLQEGSIAYTLIRPLPADSPEARKRPKLELTEKAKLYQRATTDLAAVPKPPANGPAADALAYLRVRLQLAQLHVAAGDVRTCKMAEGILNDIRAAIPTFTDLKGDEKETIILFTEIVRIDAVFEQARQLLQAKKYKEAADRLAGLVAEVAAAGPAVKPGQSPAVGQLADRLDKSRVSYAVVPALNARVQEGDIAKAGELLDVLKKLGGDARRGIAAVFQVVDATRPQIAALKRSGKKEEAEKLSADVSQLVSKLAAEPKLTDGDNWNLGHAFLQLANYPKALELLNRVPKPDAASLEKWAEGRPKKVADETDDAFRERADAWQENDFAVRRYRLAAQDRARALRLSGDLVGAGQLLNEVMGPEKQKEKAPAGKMVRAGYFAKLPEFRREANHLLEAEAAIAAPPQKTAMWVRAITDWREMNGEYRGFLIRPEPKDDQAAAALRQQKDGIRPLFFDTFYEMCRCQAAAFTDVNMGNAAGLAKGMAGVARNLHSMEKSNVTDFDHAAHANIAELLEDYPTLNTAYTAAGGKLFLTKPADE